MADESARKTIRVEVAYGTPQRQLVLPVEMPAGSTLEEAIERSGIRDEFPGLVVDSAAVGVFGKKAAMNYALRDGDRVEIYRPLIANPREARRLRAQADSKQRN